MTAREELDRRIARDREASAPLHAGAAWLITLVVCSWVPIIAVALRCYRGAHG